MMRLAKLIRIGNSVGIVIPTATLRNLRVVAGDYVYLTETPDGYRLTPYHPVLEAQLGVASVVSRQFRQVLRALED